ncbi:hypothetical protein Tco_1547532 [Tanacetum coccineum]
MMDNEPALLLASFDNGGEVGKVFLNEENVFPELRTPSTDKGSVIVLEVAKRYRTLLEKLNRVSIAYDVSVFYQETSTDTECDEGSEDTCEDLNSPYKRPKPTPFTPRITRFKYHERAKLPRNIRIYEGNKDPEDHLSIFSAAAEQEE